MSASDSSRWTIKTQEAFSGATNLARAAANPEVTPEHLLMALLSQDDGVTLPTLAKMGLSVTNIRNKVNEKLAKIPKAYGTSPEVARSTYALLEKADKEREAMGDDYLPLSRTTTKMRLTFPWDSAPRSSAAALPP